MREFIIKLVPISNVAGSTANSQYVWKLVKPQKGPELEEADESNDPFSLSLDENELTKFLTVGFDSVELRESIGKRVLSILRNSHFWEKFLVFASQGPEKFVRLVIEFQPNSDTQAIFRVPWEIAAGKNRVGEIPNCDRPVSIVRYLPIDAALEPEVINPPLKMMLLKGHPGEPGNLLKIDDEVEHIKTAIRRLRILDTENMIKVSEEWATLESLQAKISALKPHVIIFLGHGVEDGGEVKLVFYETLDADGKPKNRRYKLLTKFAEEITPLSSEVRLVILDACSTTGSLQAFEQGARTLLNQRVGAVIAIQGKIHAETSLEFLRGVLEDLLLGRTLDEAVLNGRKNISRYEKDNFLDKQHGDWARPILILGSLNEGVFQVSDLFSTDTNRRIVFVRNNLSLPESLSPQEATMSEELLNDLNRAGGDNGGRRVFLIQEKNLAESRVAVHHALNAFQKGHGHGLIYIIKTPLECASVEPIINDIKAQALGLEDEPVLENCQWLLNRLARRVEADIDALRDLKSDGRTVYLENCTNENQKGWKPFLDSMMRTQWDSNLLLCGPAVKTINFEKKYLLANKTPAAPADFPSLRESLGPEKWRVLQVLSLVRQPVRAEVIYQVLQEGVVFDVLKQFRADRPDFLLAADDHWSLTEEAKTAIAAMLDKEEKSELHWNIAKYFYRQSGGDLA